jgi:hypothetical protein
MDEEIPMRFTDDRYNYERLCLDLAMRMIQFEARTYTIRQCTGLSDDRVRKLYKSYVANERSAANIKRRRGKSPREIQCVLQNSQTQLQASLLASAMVATGLLDRSPTNAAFHDSVHLGEQLCNAYEVYTDLLSDQPLSFEHAWFLWHALIDGSDLHLRPCNHCGGLSVQDRFSLRIRMCAWCGTKQRSA